MKKLSKNILENLTLITQLGLMMLVPIVGGVLLGAWLDSKWGTSPWLLILGVILGVASAFRNLMVLGMKQSRTYEKGQTPSQYVQTFEKKVSEEKNTHGKDGKTKESDGSSDEGSKRNSN